jgi:hypothetical protein
MFPTPGSIMELILLSRRHKMLNKLESLAKNHPLSILFVGPLLGFAFVVFLPAIGFFLIGKELWLKATAIIARSTNSRANLLRIYRRR